MNYGELKTHFQAMLNRRDLTTSLRASFLDMAIARIQRELRAPLLETAMVVTIGATYTELEIPSDYIALVSLTVVGKETKLQRVDIMTAEKAAETIGTPRVFARRGTSWILGPTPEAGAQIRIDYYGELTALTADEDTNVLSLVAPDLIVYAALVYASEYFLDKRLEAFESRYSLMLNALQGQADFDELNSAFMRPCYTV